MRRPCVDREDDPASGKRSLGARANQTLGPRIVRSPALTTVPAGLIFEKTLAKCRAIRRHQHGMSASISLLGHPFARRSSVWVSQACGSTAFIFAVYADRRTMPINQLFANVSGTIAVT
jgi:hypothetical protein